MDYSNIPDKLEKATYYPTDLFYEKLSQIKLEVFKQNIHNKSISTYMRYNIKLVFKVIFGI